MSDEHRDPAYRHEPGVPPRDTGEQAAPEPERPAPARERQDARPEETDRPPRTEGDRDRAAGREAPAREQPDGSPLHPRDTSGG
jgi:hypothetical protein